MFFFGVVVVVLEWTEFVPRVANWTRKMRVGSIVGRVIGRGGGGIDGGLLGRDK